ncbi:MAG TPA: glycine cleavage system aminomethyltransferase GcvT [Woeseiaceae bacterium]|nr:glycine cleavage system aminomethyltransferase GcvT [Woeseiaceae bacterium]
MGRKTPLHDDHVAAGARMVDFGGWDMPLHYGSQIEEHHAVRRRAGVFDVSHMGVVDIGGEKARDYLRHLLANDVARLDGSSKALYSCMLNEAGGVLDDLIVYRLADGAYRLVVNAGTRDKDLAWMRAQAGSYGVTIRERDDLAMLAVQGPEAREATARVLGPETGPQALALGRFSATELGDRFVSRTGYTGEDGFEVALPAGEVGALWRSLLAAGVAPCGLGARDTLRLEAGMNLYGADMDETTSPLESGLGWTIAWDPADRDFIGRRALEARRGDPGLARFAGLLLEGRGVLRSHQRVVVEGKPDGTITSGGFSPTIGRAIALARLPAGDYTRAKVDVRGKLLDVRVVDPPFVRMGKICINGVNGE